MSDGEPLSVPPQLHDPPFLAHLYVAHFLARWSARMWEFAVGLYMIHVWSNSLLLPAIYGVVESSSVALFGPFIGQWVDILPYEKLLQLWLVTQNLSFVIAGVSVKVLVAFSSIKSTNFTAFTALVLLTNISGAIGVLSTLAGTILVERDWVMVISQGHPLSLLTRINSLTRRIDLSCKLLAPVVTGFIISFISVEALALTLALSATTTVWVEYWLFMSVYRGTPSLGEISLKRGLRSATVNAARGKYIACQRSDQVSTGRSWISKRIEQISEASYVAAWKVYLQQEVVPAGGSLALLYFTVLSFNALMTATLEWQGIATHIIGIARGISATTGIAATVAYPALQARISTTKTGLWSIWSQWCCLLMCVGSIWVKEKKMSAYMLMGGVATSRFGLWMFDLAVTQQMQEQVSESERCVVGGVQSSLQSTLELLGHVMGIIISNPKDFWKLNLTSVGVVTAAAFLYTGYLYKLRKHPFHLENLWFQLNSISVSYDSSITTPCAT